MCRVRAYVLELRVKDIVVWVWSGVQVLGSGFQFQINIVSSSRRVALSRLFVQGSRFWEFL